MSAKTQERGGWLTKHGRSTTLVGLLALGVPAVVGGCTTEPTPDSSVAVVAASTPSESLTTSTPEGDVTITITQPPSANKKEAPTPTPTIIGGFGGVIEGQDPMPSTIPKGGLDVLNPNKSKIFPAASAASCLGTLCTSHVDGQFARITHGRESVVTPVVKPGEMFDLRIIGADTMDCRQDEVVVLKKDSNTYTADSVVTMISTCEGAPYKLQ